MKSGQVAKIGTAALLSLGVLGGTVSMASAERNGDGQAEKQQFLASPRTLAQAIAAAEKESGGKAMDASWEAAGTAGSVDLAPLAHQNGLFSTLPVTKEQVERLRKEHAIYMAGSGRINVAGLHQGNIDKFVKALADVTG